MYIVGGEKDVQIFPFFERVSFLKSWQVLAGPPDDNGSDDDTTNHNHYLFLEGKTKADGKRRIICSL
jgi:hypothetical protein